MLVINSTTTSPPTSNVTLFIVILDETRSMEENKAEIIKGYNSFLDMEQPDINGSGTVSFLFKLELEELV